MINIHLRFYVLNIYYKTCLGFYKSTTEKLLRIERHSKYKRKRKRYSNSKQLVGTFEKRTKALDTVKAASKARKLKGFEKLQLYKRHTNTYTASA